MNTNKLFPRFAVIFFMLGLPFVLACNAISQLYFPATPIPPATSTWTPTATSTPPLTPTATATPTATEIPAVCGGPRTMFILLIGSDARSNTYNVGLADAIRIVRVDFVEPGVQALAFPRDLYVQIPGIADHGGITHGKLNQAFLYGNPGYGYTDSPDLGPGLLAETLELNFGASSDLYISTNLQTFVKAIDAIGGVDVVLPYVVDGRVKGSFDNNRYFPAGKQHLNGYRTMLLARMRPQGDLQRNEVQNIILQALAKKLLSPDVIVKLPELADAFKGSVQTNISPVEIGQLACLATMIDSQNVEFMSFPEELFESARVQDPILGRTSILEANFDVLRSYVQRFETGNWNVESGRDVEFPP
ncbi:MAG TPA: LCP family protein [Anaerolineales bacterium]|nr:LCP family protein [Anaerolineales bacterium]